MYRTPDGIRVLQGAERQLIVESLGMIVDQLADEDFSSDLPLFADLTRNQMIAAYHVVGRALLCEDEPPSPLTAALESAVASLYDHIGDMIGLELSDESDESDEFGGYGPLDLPSWRERAIAAGRQLEITNLPAPDEQDLDAWDLLIGSLEDRVLWDRDWELVAALDAAPEAARRVERELGITADYFVAIPDDPSDADAERLLAALVSLTAEVR